MFLSKFLLMILSTLSPIVVVVLAKPISPSSTDDDASSSSTMIKKRSMRSGLLLGPDPYNTWGEYCRMKNPFHPRCRGIAVQRLIDISVDLMEPEHRDYLIAHIVAKYSDVVKKLLNDNNQDNVLTRRYSTLEYQIEQHENNNNHQIDMPPDKIIIDNNNPDVVEFKQLE